MLLRTSVAVIALAVSGAIYQAVATLRDRRNYPPPGQLVDVGGHRLHLYITGEDRGGPTVVLEGGLGFPSVEWAWVQQEVARFARAVSYDRAGVVWSEPSPKPRDGQRTAEELHTALHVAGVEGPNVLVGHSFGGLFARAFANLYPDEVAGMVLVDSTHPDQLERSRLQERAQPRIELIIKVAPFLAYFGLIHLYTLMVKWIRKLPSQQAAEMRVFLASPKFWAVVGAEVAAWKELTAPQVRRSQMPGDMPLVVLTASGTVADDPVHGELQAELATLSSNSMHAVVDGSDHGSIVMSLESARVVAGYVFRVWKAARSSQPLAPRDQLKGSPQREKR